MSADHEKIQSPINNTDKIWEKLIHSKIYFGHMSVGYNIIEGINDIIRENKLEGLNIIETNQEGKFSQPIFGHSTNGVNTDPISKINSFSNLIQGGLGAKVDIAFFKFCYVDIIKDSDVDSIFKSYQKNMNELIKKYPKVKFIHSTVPITTHKHLGLKTKIKDMIKSIIGRETYEEMTKQDNVKRNIYNNLLRTTYKKKDILDLSKIESIDNKGQKEIFIYNGKEYESLVPEYTSDGGHLNKLGRIVVANAFLNYLAEL